jgi:hypothetical protein
LPRRAGGAALNGATNTDDVGYSTLGARAAAAYALANGMTLMPRASAAWQHAFGEVVPQAALAFQSIGTAFTIAGVPIARDAALVAAGADLRISPRATLGLSYSGLLAAGAGPIRQGQLRLEILSAGKFGPPARRRRRKRFSDGAIYPIRRLNVRSARSVTTRCSGRSRVPSPPPCPGTAPRRI